MSWTEAAMRVGSQIAGYRLTEVLGQGGMGSVYGAIDERLGRSVAIKLLDHSEMQPAQRERLLREAVILSQLQHPNVCTLYGYVEGELHDALVLERIDGPTLAEARRQGLDHRARLRIACEIASALAAAHARGIVHRDLKPENVVLTPERQAKVVDFGVAHLALDGSGQRSGAHRPERQQSSFLVGTEALPEGYRRLTQDGSIIGSLLSMSPEQARGEPPTPASDQYSFGLLLQELFSTQPPYPSGMTLPTALEWVSQGKTEEADVSDPDLARLIEDLKALDPARRPTAAQALNRLERVASWRQRLLHRVALLCGALGALVALLLYVNGIQHERARAVAAEAEAREALGRAEQARRDQGRVLDFVVKLFEVSDPGSARGRTITGREIVDDASRRLAQDSSLAPSARAELQRTIGRLYRNLGLLAEARTTLEQAFPDAEKALGAEHPATIAALYELALLDQAEHKPEAEARLQRVIAAREQALGPNDPSVAEALNGLAIVYGYSGELAKAKPLFERVVSIRETSLGPQHTLTAAALSNLAIVYAETGEPEKALALFERALAIRETILPADHPDLAIQREALAVLKDNLGDREGALRLHDLALATLTQTLGEDHPRTILTRRNRIGVLIGLGRLGEAERLLPGVIEATGRVQGEDHPDSAIAREHLASLRAAQGRKLEAATELRRVIALRRAALGPEHPLTRQAEQSLATLEGRIPAPG